MCRHYIRGFCNQNNLCNFAHGDKDLRQNVNETNLIECIKKKKNDQHLNCYAPPFTRNWTKKNN